MEPALTCLALVLIAAMLVPFALAFAHARKIKALETAVQRLTARLTSLESQPRAAAPAPAEPLVRPAEQPAPVPAVSAAKAAAVPPPLPSQVRAAPTPPVAAVPPPALPKPAAKPRAAIDWESFLGVKLFAWIGGFVLFLGVVFLVKYSFENNLITPMMRVIIGAVIGCTLVGAGWFAAQRNYRVPGQSLCATGVVILYADIFGAHAFYDLLSLGSAFGLMCLVTIGAFFLAVRLNAQVVVILGLLGGFLTPPLLSRHADEPLRLFGYIALLDLGIAAVVLRKRWNYLLVLAAIGTVIMQMAWVDGFGPGKATTGFLIFLGFEALFLLFAWLRGKSQPSEKWSLAAACVMGASALGFGFLLLNFRELATRPGYFFGFTFLADIGLLALALSRKNPARIAAPAGSVVFLLLASWTALFLQHDLLWWALGAFLLFALIHAGFSVWPPRDETKTAVAPIWQSYVPLLALILLFIAVSRGETSFALWACVLLVDIIAVGLAITSKSVIALIAALFFTIITAALWIVTAPPIDESVVGILIVVGGFGVFFSTAASFLTRQLGLTSGDSRRHVPALAAAMPFVLLLMVIQKLPIGAPTAVFSVALLLAILLLALGILSRTSWIAAVAFVSTWAVERAWQTLDFTNSYAVIALGWYVVFLLLFVAYPFFSAEEKSWLPWSIGALSGVFHFWLIDNVVSAAYPDLRNGLLPALFIIPFAFGVWHLIKKRGVVPSSGDARLAWQGGAALFFLSLLFPIQFDREWITLGWAVEGLALLALFRSVPNAGLRIVGAGLLTLAFVRLALNPAVFEYHKRTPLRIWNWYLYAYGLTSLCLLGGAHLVRTYRETLLARVVPRLLYTLGTILTFLLLNIEIADFFSIGPTLTFSFTGNFARDMSYSIAWALFAFALLLVGMKKNMRYVRYAGLVLLLVTLVKLFLHDLGYLSQLYRIGAFIGVALILIIASFVYQ
ncbi:MAG: DUF2339 domain-containing protein, partial [Chthoniobacterales bacterium]